MSKKNVFITMSILSTWLTSCFPFSHTNKQIVDKYVLSASDSKDQMIIYYEKKEGYGGEAIIPETVIEYAVIDKFIFAKQVMLYDFENENFSNFNYYIIRIGEDKSKKVTHEEYSDLVKENNIVVNNIDWKKTW